MPQLTFIPIEDVDRWEMVKAHPTGVYLQKQERPVLEYRVVLNKVLFATESSINDADFVYSLLLKIIKLGRPKPGVTQNNAASTLSAAPNPTPALNLPSTVEDRNALMDRLKKFVTTYNDSHVHRLIHELKFEEARKLLDKNSSLMRVHDPDGDTPLHIACMYDRYDFVRYMLNYAARKGGFYWDDGGEAIFDVNARNHAQWTPLHCAAFGFHFKICDMLLKETPVSVNCITEPNKSSPLHFLARFQDSAVYESSASMNLNNALPNTSQEAPATIGGSSTSSYNSTTWNAATISTSITSPSPYLNTNIPSRAMSVQLTPQQRDAVLKDTNPSLSAANPLFSATTHQQLLEVLNGLLEAGADLNARDVKGETPLHVAANFGSVYIAEWLICNRADVNVTSFATNETPLHMAVRGKNLIIVELLVGANADLNAISKHGTPLELAKLYSSPDITKFLQEQSSRLSKSSDADSQELVTPPNSITAFNDEPKATINDIITNDIIIAEHKNLNNSIQSSSVSPEKPPIFSVATHTSLAQPQNPINTKTTSSSPSSTTSSASTVTGTAISSIVAQDSSNPSNNNSPDSILSFSSIAQSLPSIASLPFAPFRHLRRVVENALFSPGKTPLHDAVIQNKPKLVSYILKIRPALINAKDQHKWTPILYAAAHGYIKLTAQLAQAGADVSVVDLDESGILHFLARNKRSTASPIEFGGLLDILISSGISLDTANMFGATPLHEAAARNNIVVLQALCEAGCKLEPTAKNGDTPLIYAARENCVDSVNYLLHRGANMEIAGKNGTAVDVARNSCHVSVLKVFLFYKTHSTIGYHGVSSLNSSGNQTSPGPKSFRSRSSSAVIAFNSASTPQPVSSPSSTKLVKVMASSGSPSDNLSQLSPLSTSPTSTSIKLSAPNEDETFKTVDTQTQNPPHLGKFSAAVSAPSIVPTIPAPSPNVTTSQPSTPRNDPLQSEDESVANSWSSFLSPRRHLTLSIAGGASIDYNKVYDIHEPLLAAFPCYCTINSPVAAFKDTEGFIIVWQHYIAFGHVAMTSSGVLAPDSSFNWKFSFQDFSNIALTKSLFGGTKLTLVGNSIVSQLNAILEQQANGSGARSASATDPTINITITRCERLEALDKLLQYLWNNRDEPDRLTVEAHPLEEMVGAILYPKENADFHKHFPEISASETVLEHLVCNHKEEGTFASKNVFITQHRLCFGKRNWTQIPFEDVKTLKKQENKTIIMETSVQKYTFNGIADRDAIFSLIESLWNAQQSDNRIVLFAALGRRTLQMTELFIEKASKMATGSPDIYIRWVLIQGYHVLDKRQQDALRDVGVEVVWLSPKFGYTAIPEILQYMRKVVLLYLDFDPKFLEVSELLIHHCKPAQVKQVIVTTLALGDLTSYLAESISLLQELVRTSNLSATFIQSNPAFMQLLEDEFVDIKRDWRFRLPWGSTAPKLAWVDLRDVVDVTVNISLSRDPQSHQDKMYYIAGPEALTCEEIAAVITQMTEQEVRYIGVALDELKSILRQSLLAFQTKISAGQSRASRTLQSSSKTLSMLQYLPAIISHNMAEISTFAQSSASTIVKRLQNSLVFEDKDIDFDTQQYLTIFKDLTSNEMHSVVSTLTTDIVKVRPRSIRTFVLDHLDSFKEKGVYNFTSVQRDCARRQFSEMATGTTQTQPLAIEPSQYSRLLSPAIASNSPNFAKRLYRIYDIDGLGKITMEDFVKITSILVNGDPKDQLLIACDIFDSNSDQIICSQDIADLADELSLLLQNLGITSRQYGLRTLLNAKGLQGYPREAPLPSVKFHQVGVSLASFDRPLKDQVTAADFSYILKLNRAAISSLGSFSANVPAPNGSTLPSDFHSVKSKRSGIYVSPGHQLWELVFRVATGISHVVQEEATQGTIQMAELTPGDCDRETETKISGPTEPEIWTFSEYGGPIFRKIRQLSGVSSTDYLASLGIETILGNLVLGRINSFEEISSSGRSGSFFLKTFNSKFLVKSLPIDEHNFLRKNLWKYYSHLLEHPDSLLARFYGLHKIKCSNREFCFVIMANLFATPLEIHEQYDLKGSTVNRYVGEKMQFWSPSIAMKDLDFHRRLKIGPERKAIFLQQAEMDAIFMETFNICDYSLLVGIHYAENPVSDSLLKGVGTGKLGCFPGYPDPEEDEHSQVYYFCNLIDILTQYNLKKKGESALKSIVHKKSQISAISPNPYRKRFMRFLTSIMD